MTPTNRLRAVQVTAKRINPEGFMNKKSALRGALFCLPLLRLAGRTAQFVKGLAYWTALIIIAFAQDTTTVILIRHAALAFQVALAPSRTIGRVILKRISVA